MELLAYPILAIAPGIFWLWFFIRGRSYRPNPRRLLAFAFFLGMLFVPPAAVLEFVLLGDVDLDRLGEMGLASVAAMMLFVVGPVEEASKFLAVRLGPYRSLYFDEPSDGLEYAAAASLGFASLENLVYILSFGPAVMIVRAPISTLGHVIWGSFWGYGLGVQAQHGRRGRRLWLAVSLVVAAALHGAFNTLLFTLSPLGPLLALLLTALGLWWTLSRFRWAQRISPFRLRRNYPRVACPGCGRYNSVVSRYCQSCGWISPASRPSALACGNCGAPARPDASYCIRCGDRLLRR